MASKNTIYQTAAVVNAHLNMRNAGTKIDIYKDAAGYAIHEYGLVAGTCRRTIKYGLRAKEIQAILDGMLVYEDLLR